MYHGLLPSKRIRWCCADFKEGAGAGRVTLTGVRRKESARRARRNEMEVSGRRFSGTADEFERWQAGQVEKIRRRMLRQQGKHLGEDYFSIDKDREVRCIGGKDTIIVNPLLDWSEQDVWYFLDSVAAVPHCELYDRGYRRIGCILCPMSSYRQKVREMQDYPHVRRLWIKAIKEIRRGGELQGTDTCQPGLGIHGREDTSQPVRNTGCRCGQWSRKRLTGMWAGFLPAPLGTASGRGGKTVRRRTRLPSASLTGGSAARATSAGMLIPIYRQDLIFKHTKDN